MKIFPLRVINNPPPLQVAPESEKLHKQERPFFLGQNFFHSAQGKTDVLVYGAFRTLGLLARGGGYLWLEGEKFSQLRIPVFNSISELI